MAALTVENILLWRTFRGTATCETCQPLLIAREVTQENDASTFSSTEEDMSDFIENFPRVEKVLYPKCERESFQY